VGNPKSGQRPGEQGFGVVGAHANALRAVGGLAAIQFKSPGEHRRQAFPVQAVVFVQLAGMGRGTTAFQVGRAGAGDAHDTGQGRGDQPGIDDMPGPQYQVDFAQMLALHVDKAVDQVQVYVEARVHVKKVSNGRRQVPSTEGSRRVHADQPFRRMAQRHRFGPRQL